MQFYQTYASVPLWQSAEIAHNLTQLLCCYCGMSLCLMHSWTKWRNLKGEIGFLFDPVSTLTRWQPFWQSRTDVSYCTSGFGGIIWCGIIVAVCFTTWYPKCVHDLSPCKKGNPRLKKLLGGLSYEKIRRYNNSPPYMMARWPPQQILPLHFLGPNTCVHDEVCWCGTSLWYFHTMILTNHLLNLHLIWLNIGKENCFTTCWLSMVLERKLQIWSGWFANIANILIS